MSDRKFTDDEVIKALELCFAPKGTTDTCAKCPYHEFARLCKINRDRDALALINRQQAEIERLEHSGIRANSVEDWLAHCNKLRAEGIKELAERLKEEYEDLTEFAFVDISLDGLLKKLDNLVKEMTEGGEPRKDVGK